MQLLLVFLISLLIGDGVLSVSSAMGASSRSAQIATLKEQLESGLKARRPQEFQFIGRVVQMVDQKRLPMKTVKSTFQWARRKKPYPYPFFERALKIRAARKGIRIQ